MKDLDIEYTSGLSGPLGGAGGGSGAIPVSQFVIPTAVGGGGGPLYKSPLEKEAEELRKQVAERDALLAEKDAALLFAFNRVTGHATDGRSVVAVIEEALAKTLPSEALERALAAERRRGLPTSQKQRMQ